MVPDYLDGKKSVTVMKAVDQIRHLLTEEPINVQFLGVFDTVSAIGRHGMRRGEVSHDMSLRPHVQTARQALAIDEHRLKFAPLLWSRPTDLRADVATGQHRVKQVWFQGAHADVGGSGGGEFNGLADTPLLWMLLEAYEHGGLEINYRTLKRELLHRGSLDENRSLTLLWRSVEAPLRLVQTLVPNRAYKGRNRRLIPPNAAGVSIASSAQRRYRMTATTWFTPDGEERTARVTRYHPKNLAEVIEQCREGSVSTEEVNYLPFDIPWPGLVFKLLPEPLTGLNHVQHERNEKDLWRRAGNDSAHWGRVRTSG